MSTRRTIAVRACAIALCAGAPLAPPASNAGDMASFAIQRCQDAAGEVVYTDRSCAASKARPTPMPQELISRIVYDSTQTETLIALGMHRDDMMRGPIPTRRPPVAGCARTPRQLSLDLQGALAMHDVNRLAESFHWVGMTHRQSHRIMDRLRRLSDQPVHGAQYFNAQIGPADAMTDAISPDSAGMLQLLMASGSGSTVVDLDVRRYSGCYFVTFQHA